MTASAKVIVTLPVLGLAAARPITVPPASVISKLVIVASVNTDGIATVIVSPDLALFAGITKFHAACMLS